MTKENRQKIKNLAKAFEAIGVHTEIDWNAEWYCIDDEIHVGVELHTNIFTGEDVLEIIFNPDGEYIEYCTDAPIKK